jgi:triacylglycerol esterase/lipase EstA (alpha/beta hydrolase family)
MTSGVGRVHVALVPGFFGFANLGDLAYFGHVHAFLLNAYRARGVEPVLHVVQTHPTASVVRRAVKLLHTLATDADDDAPIHLVGHSSGGLDCRLLLDPGVELPGTHAAEPIAARVTRVVTVATPHRGTPLAEFFATRLGGALLEILSLATMHGLRLGQVPLKVLLVAGAAYAKLDDLGPNSALLDQLFRDLLADFTPARRAAITQFLNDVRSDRALLTQLTPDAMETFEATTHDRPGVPYGAVVTRAIPPSLASWTMPGLDPSAHVLHLLYRALHAATRDSRAHLPALDPATVLRLRDAYGTLPDPTDNDGVVPTLSQLHGELVCATAGDHLDVIGHFGDRSVVPPHFDWLVTGTGFDHTRFEAVWTTIADWLTAARPASGAGIAGSRP